MNGRLHIGYFTDDHDVLAAARACRQRGLEIVDLVSPYPLHGADEALGLAPSRIAWVTLLTGALGLALGLGFQYWSAGTDWPLNVGGKPFDSLPAFVPVAFETTILLGGLGTALALFALSGLWPGRRAHGEFLRRTTDDQHALVLRQADARLAEREYRELLLVHGAVEALQVMEEEL